MPAAFKVIWYPRNWKVKPIEVLLASKRTKLVALKWCRHWNFPKDVLQLFFSGSCGGEWSEVIHEPVAYFDRKQSYSRQRIHWAQRTGKERKYGKQSRRVSLTCYWDETCRVLAQTITSQHAINRQSVSHKCKDHFYPITANETGFTRQGNYKECICCLLQMNPVVFYFQRSLISK